MDDFLQLVSKQLGIGTDVSRNATSGIMRMVQERLGDTDFAQISSKIPGIQALLNDSDTATSAGSGGLLGSLTSLAGSLLGDKVGSLAEIAGVLAKSGISLEKSADFMKLLVDFLKQKLGSQTFEVLMAKLPELLGVRK
jgi:hypothetical protein